MAACTKALRATRRAPPTRPVVVEVSFVVPTLRKESNPPPETGDERRQGEGGDLGLGRLIPRSTWRRSHAARRREPAGRAVLDGQHQPPEQREQRHREQQKALLLAKSMLERAGAGRGLEPLLTHSKGLMTFSNISAAPEGGQRKVDPTEPANGGAMSAPTTAAIPRHRYSVATRTDMPARWTDLTGGERPDGREGCLTQRDLSTQSGDHGERTEDEAEHHFLDHGREPVFVQLEGDERESCDEHDRELACGDRQRRSAHRSDQRHRQRDRPRPSGSGGLALAGATRARSQQEEERAPGNGKDGRRPYAKTVVWSISPATTA